MLRCLLVASLLAAGPLGAQSAVPIPALDPRNIDRKYGACDDFFMFANNGWIERNPIPDASSDWSTFSALAERNALVLKTIAERAAAQVATTSDPTTRTLGTFYASCMDSTAAERAGIAPIADELRRIAAISDRDALQDEIARMLLLGYGGPFGFGAAPDAKNARLMIADVIPERSRAPRPGALPARGCRGADAARAVPRQRHVDALGSPAIPIPPQRPRPRVLSISRRRSRGRSCRASHFRDANADTTR